jgi:predicted deacylase
VEALVSGTLGVMRYLKMLPGPVTPVENPVWLERVEAVPSEQTGIFRPLVGRGAYVEKGMKLGVVTDYLGSTLYEPRAPAAGVVLFVRAVPSLTKGEPVASIGVPAR